MKFSIPRETLLAPISQVVNVVERRQTLPVLANFLIEAVDEGLRITGTDMEVEVIARAKAEVAQTGSITVPARKLVDICRALPEGVQINVQLNDDKLALHAGRSRFSLATLPATEFPSSDQAETLQTYEVNQGRLRWLLEKTSFAMAQQDVRHYLNGLLLEFREGQLRAVATDGHRLALAEAEAEISGEVRSVIVPRKGVMELNRVLEDIDEPLKVMLGQGFLRVDRERIVMTTKLIDGRFPDYEAVIPLRSDDPIRVDRGEMTHALQRAAILSNEKYRGVRLEMLPDTLKIVAHNPQQEEATEEIEAEHSIEKLKVGFNVNYLLDALGSMEGEKVAISIKDANSSCLVTDTDSEAVRQVVMPLKL
ncbi:DNA polymerase III subunit beta [Wenzhouxiangella sp. XN201]|uniref:DNA polymerase III subunit beta n=1 Tax=Wenzhouxiangella sp. XN201 TaxID=2710755 RepID=UPI0013CA4F80|nr:DNA polymerase III subunit beta [Wenzhouxiangella sp. XN201]NEZ04369.1 DNA polymerase III subunit beta [Wenzhouxiangella sp. XN201]